jgi:hypothetical protein
MCVNVVVRCSMRAALAGGGHERRTHQHAAAIASAG